ncbi:hypothetical protein B0H13DRAFT_1613688 [Mycena leptocephala]|nr:hypothetical protein B0H13DRAFT_1613688 [Mycena leptocephala]
MAQPTVLPPGADSDPTLLLGPDLARQLQVASLVFSGTVAVFIWDILDNLHDDISLLFKHKFGIPTAAYLVSSRITSFAYVLGVTFFATYPLGNCVVALITFDAFYPILSGATALLFFLRVRAVFGGQRLVNWFFGFFWIAVVGTAITIPIGTRGTNVGKLCIVTDVPSYLGVHRTTMAVYDTSIFLAISYRLLANLHNERTPGKRIQFLFRGLFRGTNMHTFSNALFRDGQKYYMIAVLSNILTVSMVFASHVSPIYRGTFSIPNVALTSIMACRVYRNARLHNVRSAGGSIPLSNSSGAVRFVVPRSPVTVDQSFSQIHTKRFQQDHDVLPQPPAIHPSGGLSRPSEVVHINVGVEEFQV